MPNATLSRFASRVTPAVMALSAAGLFFALSAVVHAAVGKRDIDFSNYDVPLYVQITNRIKEKVSRRLGNSPNEQDRYFIIPFAYENRGNKPEFSHSFLSVIRVFADHRQPKSTREFKVRTYKRWEFEAFTVSWLPADFMKNPRLCVFDGFGARMVPSMNRCPLSPGKSFTLADTIKLAVDSRVAVCMWGPYEISKEGFDLAVKRTRLLNEGKIKYRADDRMYRKDLVAINCFHAIAGIYELFPNGGLFGTGFRMWGINGTTRVLMEYTAKATRKRLLLDPVDVKKDRYGFVYAPDRSGRSAYVPFKTASAYRR